MHKWLAEMLAICVSSEKESSTRVRFNGNLHQNMGVLVSGDTDSTKKVGQSRLQVMKMKAGDDDVVQNFNCVFFYSYTRILGVE